MKQVQHKIISALLLIFLAFSVFSCKKPVPEETIKIGFAGPLSGEMASKGIPSRRATEIVIDKVNKKGGVNGKKVILFVENDMCRPEVAVNVASRLANKKVDGVIGHVCSGAMTAALSHSYKKHHIVNISFAATGPALTQSGEYPTFFRTIAADDAQAQIQMDLALNILGLKKIALIHDRSDYGLGLVQYTKRFIEVMREKDVEIVLFDGLIPGASDLMPTVRKIKESGADGVIFGGYHPDGARLVSQIRKAGLQTVFIGADGIFDETFPDLAGKYAEGVFATGPIDVSQNPLAIEAEREHLAAYHEPSGTFYLEGYAAILALLHAIEEADSTEPDAIMEALHTEYVDTPIGKIKFDEKGDATGVGFVIYQVKGDKFVPYTVDECSMEHK